jgi:ACS family glucarate transporter-like MFS transporter
MNTFGNLGGWVSPVLTAYIATHFGWNRALDFAALVTIASAACWIFVDAGQSFDGKLEK